MQINLENIASGSVGIGVTLLAVNAFVAYNRREKDKSSTKREEKIKSYLYYFGEIRTNMKCSLGFEDFDY